jgi:hypothetical protein
VSLLWGLGVTTLTMWMRALNRFSAILEKRVTASCSVGTEDFPGCEADGGLKLTTRLHLVPWLRMHGPMIPLSYIIWWRAGDMNTPYFDVTKDSGSTVDEQHARRASCWLYTREHSVYLHHSAVNYVLGLNHNPLKTKFKQILFVPRSKHTSFRL